MAIQIYDQDTIKAAVMQLSVYFIQLLAKFAVRQAMDRELRGLKINIPADVKVEDLDFEVFEILEGPIVEIMRTSMRHIVDAQDRFILINALSIDRVEDHGEGLDLGVEIAEYFLVPTIENFIHDIPADINGFYLNLEYLLHLLAYLLFHGQIDLDSKDFQGYWCFDIDKEVFGFIHNEEKNISLIKSLIDNVVAANCALCEIWNNED